MGILGRIARRLAVRMVRGVYRRRGLLALASIATAGFLVLSSFNVLPGLPTMSTSTEPGYQRGAEGEPASTANYIRGQQTEDAQLVWDAYSERIRRELQRQGQGIEDVQQQLSAARQRGGRLVQAQYIGGYPIPNGSMHFYVITRTSGRGGNVAYVPYTFTLDANGKIERIE